MQKTLRSNKLCEAKLLLNGVKPLISVSLTVATAHTMTAFQV